MSEEVRNVNYVGIDIGSTASKVVVRGTSDMQFVLPTGWSSKETTQTIKEKLKENDVDVLGDETKVVATGYGRIAVDFADYVITEITCHARGGRELAGGDCTVIDVGGQDTKVILIENGMVQDFLMNDKCSAGTGKFLEIMANRLGVTLQELLIWQKREPCSQSVLSVLFLRNQKLLIILEKAEAGRISQQVLWTLL